MTCELTCSSELGHRERESESFRSDPWISYRRKPLHSPLTGFINNEK